MTTAHESEAPSSDEAFGLVVHEAMFRQRITQTKLAAALGIHQTALSKKIHGSVKWTLREAIQVADALRLDLRDLLGQMWGDPEAFNAGGQQWNPANGQWAPRGSNSQPTDYNVAGSEGGVIIDLGARRVARSTKLMNIA